jgi:TonB-dependent receptor
LTNAQLVYDTRVGQQDKVTREFYGSMFWTPTDHLTVSVDVDHVNSHASVYSMTAFDGFGLNGNRPTVAFDLTGKTPSLKFTENGLSLSDPANYFWYAAMQHNENNRASSWAERADVTYTLDEGSFFKAFKVGIRNTAKDLVTQSTNYNWGLLSTAYWGGGTPVYLNQDPGNVGLPGQTSQLKFGSFMGGNVSVPGGWFPSVGLLDKGAANAYKYLVTTQGGNGGWSPLTDDAFNGSAGSNNAYGTNTQTEKTLAGYAMARFGDEGGLLGRFDGNIGVRVIRTRTTAVGAIFLPTLSSGSSNSQTASNCIAQHGADACAALVAAATFVGDGSKTPVDARNSYTDVLPTFNSRFYLNDKTILRFAVGKAIYRPSFTDLQANQTYNFSFQTDGYTPAVTAPRTLTGGNPYLKPIRAWNFDASFEYYFGKANAVTFAAFYKDVTNYISPQASTVTLTRNGVTQDFRSTSRSMAGMARSRASRRVTPCSSIACLARFRGLASTATIPSSRAPVVATRPTRSSRRAACSQATCRCRACPSIPSTLPCSMKSMGFRRDWPITGARNTSPMPTARMSTSRSGTKPMASWMGRSSST